VKDPQPGSSVRPRANKRLSVVLACFGIATLFWLLIELSHDYPATITFPVRYVNLPDRKVVMNELPEEVAITLRTSGFRILSFEFSSKRSPIEIDVASKLGGKGSRADALAIPTRIFQPDFIRQLGTQVSLQSYEPDSIVFYFSDQQTVRLPVVVPLTLTLARQYDTTGPLSVRPDSVNVTGPPSLIRHLRGVSTTPLELRELKTPVNQKLRLQDNRLLTYSDTLVNVRLPVEELTEARLTVPVRTMNTPATYVLKTFPDKISLRFQVPLSHYREVAESDFDVVVDGSRLLDQKPQRLPVKILLAPSWARSILPDPAQVDYILRKE
jgi:hypothetical protein